MREYIKKQLRERASVRGKQKTWISALSNDQLYELFQRLRNGESAKSIAQYIQKVWKVNPESTTHSLSQGVLKFKRRIAHLLLTPPKNMSPPAAYDVEKVEKLEGIEGLERIYQGQLERINRMIQEEAETGIKFPHLSRDIQALSALSKAIVKAKEYELLYGTVDPVRHRKAEQLQQRMDRGFQALMDYVGPDGKNEMIDCALRLFEQMEEEGLVYNMEEGGDGIVRVTDPKTGEVVDSWKKENEVRSRGDNSSMKRIS
jgi:pentatricopeptide repeat protein